MSVHFILRGDAEKDLLACAAYVAERVESGDDHSEAIAGVVPYYLERGDVDLAAELANSVDDPFVRDRLLIAVAAKCAENDDDEYARQLIDAIEEPGLQAEGIERLGMVKAGKGQFNAARAIAEEMIHPEFVEASIAVKQATDGDSVAASETISKIGFAGARVTAGNSIAQHNISSDNKEAAIEFLMGSLCDAAEIEHEEEKIRTFVEIGNLFIEAGRNGKAIEAFDKAREPAENLENVHRDALFASISTGFLRAGSQDLADRSLDLVSDKTQLSSGLLGHAKHYWQVDLKDEAAEAIDEAYEVLRSQREIETRNSRERFVLFGSIAAQFAGFGKGERGIEIAEKIEDSEHSMAALTQVAHVLTLQESNNLARQALNAIPDDGQRVFALMGMSDAAKREGRDEQTVAFLNEAAAHVEEIPQLSLRSSALVSIADRAASSEQDDLLENSVTQLFETIVQTKSRLSQSTALVSMAELVKKHDLELSETEHEKLRGIVSKV